MRKPHESRALYTIGGALLTLATKLLSVDALPNIPYQAVIVRISNCDVVAGVRKVFEQMLHLSQRSSGGQALNNMMRGLSNDPPVVPALSDWAPNVRADSPIACAVICLAAANDAAKLPVFAAFRFALSSV
jgi:hypothetical protein